MTPPSPVSFLDRARGKNLDSCQEERRYGRQNASLKKLKDMAHRRKPTTDPLLLSTLICPVSGGPLEVSADGAELLSRSARLAFPVRDGIPVMIAGEARALTDKEIGKA